MRVQLESKIPDWIFFIRWSVVPFVEKLIFWNVESPSSICINYYPFSGMLNLHPGFVLPNILCYAGCIVISNGSLVVSMVIEVIRNLILCLIFCLLIWALFNFETTDLWAQALGSPCSADSGLLKIHFYHMTYLPLKCLLSLFHYTLTFGLLYII